jgi:hypothetical protein
MWSKMTGRQRFRYLAARHPLTVVFAYFTVFLYGVCLSSFLRDPRKNWDSGLALGVHFSISAGVLFFGGFQTYAFVVLVPFLVAHALGAYLFYAQHNFPAIRIAPRESWSYARAALESSSYIPMGRALPPRAPSQSFHPLLSPSRGHGGDPGASRPRHDEALFEGHLGVHAPQGMGSGPRADGGRTTLAYGAHGQAQL